MIISYQKPEILTQNPGQVGLLKHIERCARVCYKSEDKITDDSYKHMVTTLETNGHLSCMEHGTVYLRFSPMEVSAESEKAYIIRAIEFYKSNPYSRVFMNNGVAWVTTNYRVILENRRLNDLEKYACEEPSPYHYKRVTVHFVSDISVNRDANRHRLNSISEESTIYCNYAKDKFGNELTISKPVWITDEEISKANDIIGIPVIGATANDVIEAIYSGADEDLWGPVEYWLAANIMDEFFYMKLIEKGWKAKQARTILPLDTKSELIHTAYINEWLNFFFWRAKETHPQIKELTNQLQELFVKANLANVSEIYNPKKLIKNA